MPKLAQSQIGLRAKDVSVPAWRGYAKPRRRQAGLAAALVGQDTAVGRGIEQTAHEPEEFGPVALLFVP